VSVTASPWGSACSARWLLAAHGSVYEGVPQVEELRSHVSGLLSAVAELPDALRGVAAVDLFDRFAADKKHTAETYRVVAVANDGRAELVSLPKNDNAQNQIVYAMNEILCALQAAQP